MSMTVHCFACVCLLGGGYGEKSVMMKFSDDCWQC